MFHVLNLCFQGRYLFIFHSIHNEHGKCTGSEVFYQNILSLHRLYIFRQIRQHIIIDSGIHISKSRRNQE